MSNETHSPKSYRNTVKDKQFNSILEWDYSIDNPFADEVKIFSFFNRANDVIKVKDISIDEYIDMVKDEKKKDSFLKLRALPIDEYKKTKANYLNAITGSCIVNDTGRTKNDITGLNGLFVVDFDELPDSFDNWKEFKEALATDEYCYLLHYSASGRGLCMFVKIPAENEFIEIYLSFEKYFFEKYGAVIDPLKDENRLRFVSYDNDIVSNQTSKIYTDTEKVVIAEVKLFVKKEVGSKEETPSEAFNNSGDHGLNLINNELTSRGWIITKGYGKSVFNYQRSKEASPKSMVAFYNREIVLFCVHSTNTDLKEQKYNLYELYKELNSFTDYAAAKKLYDFGFGYFFEKSETQKEIKILHDIELTANEFPIIAFPSLFRDYTIDLKNSLNFPIDYTALSILTAISTAVGSNVSLRVKDNWFELPSLYTCLVGNPGANKTHPINMAFKPLKDKDKVRQEDFEKKYNEFLKYQKLSKKERNDAPEVVEPKLEKSILNNFTTEILYKRLQQNERGCAVVSDEIISFFEGMNNYSKTDQIGIYLSFWNNQPTTIDRVSTPIPLFILEPYLSIIGGLQINALPKAFPADKINNGFLQRFLFAFPDEAIKHPINNNLQNDDLKRKYDEFIFECYKKKSKTILKWNSEAKLYFYNWQKNNCDLVNENQETIKGEIYSKFDNHFLRLATLLQIMKDIDSSEIQMDAVKGADLLCNYFINSAFKVIAKIHNPKNYFDTLPRNKKQLYEALKPSFSTAEAIAIGNQFEIKERRVKEFLKDSLLFVNSKHGEYLKTM
jgi:hypothetical protein